jgi:hypothetical protein
MSTHKLLTRSGVLYDTQGYVTARGVTVTEYPATDTLGATVVINGTVHRRDGLDITPECITSKAAGWYVVL